MIDNHDPVVAQCMELLEKLLHNSKSGAVSGSAAAALGCTLPHTVRILACPVCTFHSGQAYLLRAVALWYASGMQLLSC